MASQIPEKLRAARVARLKQIRDDRFEGSNTLLARAIKKQPDYISRAHRLAEEDRPADGAVDRRQRQPARPARRAFFRPFRAIAAR